MTRPMRSWMFVPGNIERFLDKAPVSGADAVLFDLEDGVLPDGKPGARTLVRERLERDWDGPLRYVRINAVTTPWFEEDLDAILVPGIDGICLPKAESPEDVAILSRRLDAFERQHALDVGSTRILAAIESAHALVGAPAIAAADPRVSGLMFGAEDYALDLGLGTHREGEASEMIYARSAIVVAAASAHVLSIDGVFPALDDPEGFSADVLQSRRLGFSAKSTFNPRQLDEINQVFSPQQDEIAYARRVVEAFKIAEDRGEASVAVGGQLVDRPIVLRAQRLLELVDRG
ncbi:MAG TPA: CoA ester lyase [Egicoccus sp.]|nr:CoA ester lyase [Egicoccus sp.]HSK24605.1 CoA ester lyase [Egicoccus sp.]